MGAPKNNKYWQMRSKDGRDKIYKTPEQLWEACVNYFEWVEANPLKEERIFHKDGMITRADVSKMRAMTVGGLCLFLNVDRKTWDLYRDRKDFIPVTTRADEIIRYQKFEGAAADLLNPNIIARDLGLADKSDVKTEIRITRSVYGGDIN